MSAAHYEDAYQYYPLDVMKHFNEKTYNIIRHFRNCTQDLKLIMAKENPIVPVTDSSVDESEELEPPQLSKFSSRPVQIESNIADI